MTLQDPPFSDRPLRVAVVGCGLIGRRRAALVHRSPLDQLVVVVDVDGASAASLAGELNCEADTDWHAVVTRDDVDAVVVSTTNDWLSPITIGALQLGKHVLVEKPMACAAPQAEEILRAAGYFAVAGAIPDSARDARGRRAPVIRVGFNHRHHLAVWRAHDFFEQGAIGPLLSMRCRYGHGGRPGYDKEWRMNPIVSGGGEMLDQGVHALDLFRWFAGDFAEAYGIIASYVWAPGAEPSDGVPITSVARPVAAQRGVEDNAFALFRTAAGQIASLHVSWTQWKNLFSFEVFGRDGYLNVEGLGGSYGTERLTLGRRRAEGGPPNEEHFEFSEPDCSWEAEWQDFTDAIRAGRQPIANGWDGWQVLRMVQAVYESARTGQTVRL